MKKKALILFGTLFVLLGGTGVGGYLWILAQLKKEALIAKMEEAWDCRAHLDGTEVSLLSSPATVKLVGLKLTPVFEDEEGRTEVEKPLEQRPPILDEDVLVSAKEAVLSVELTELLRGTLKIEKLHLDGVKVKAVIDKEGESSLDALFDSPEEAHEKANELPTSGSVSPPASSPVGKEEAPSAAAPVASPPPLPESVPTPAPPNASAPVAEPASATPVAPAEPAAPVAEVPAPATPAPTVPTPAAPSKPGTTPPPSLPPSAKASDGSKVLVKKSKKKKRTKKKRERKPMNASELRMNLAIKEVSISDGSFENIDLEKSTHILFDGLNVALNDIDIVPTDLANHNSCDFDLKSRIKVTKIDKQQTVADFVVSANGTAKPFDPGTSLWSPDLKLDVLLAKGGLLGGESLSKQLSKKDLKKISGYGISLDDIALGGVLKEDATARIHIIRGNKIMLEDDTRLAFPQYEITMLEKSWFNAPEDLHIARAKFVVSPELTQRIIDDAKKVVAKTVSESALLGGVVELLGSAIMDEQKRLTLSFRTKGPMSKPEVGLETAFSDIKDKLKDQGMGLLKGLLDEATKPDSPAPKQ